MSSAWLAVLAVLCVGCAGDPPDGHAPAESRGVEIFAGGCGPVAEHGSGTAIGGNLVVTVAHVVAGATSIDVRLGTRHYAAGIAAIDTQHDAAVLRLDGLDLDRIALQSASAADTGTYIGFGGLTPGAKPFAIRRPITLDSEDIYVNGDYPRAGYELTATTEAGDSGAGLVVDGAVTGVVWARSEQSDSRSYAVDISVFRPLLDRIADSPVADSPAAVPCR